MSRHSENIVINLKEKKVILGLLNTLVCLTNFSLRRSNQFNLMPGNPNVSMSVNKPSSYNGIDLVSRWHPGIRNLQEVSHSDTKYCPIHTPLHLSSTLPLTWQHVRHVAALAAIDAANSPFFVGIGHSAKEKRKKKRLHAKWKCRFPLSRTFHPSCAAILFGKMSHV